MLFRSKKFISIFLLLYITLPINAQDKTNELSGFIIHKQENGSNGSLDGANIFLIYAKDTLKTTSINGVFRFKPIKTGKAKLIITAIGCRKVEKELNIIAGKNSNLYIEILDESIQLEEVTIKECSLKLMRHFAGDSRFTAARYAHQNVNVVIMISRAQSVAPTGTRIRKLLRVTVIGNIVMPDLWRSNIHSCQM